METPVEHRPGSSPGNWIGKAAGVEHAVVRTCARELAKMRVGRVTCDHVLQMPITSRPSNWSCGMPWFFIQERCVIASRSSRPNHWVERSACLFFGDLLLMAV